MIKARYFLLVITLFLLSCVGVVFDPEKVADTFSWNISEGSDLPDDAILFECKAKETFYIKYLEAGKSLWIAFPKRELRLYQDEKDTTQFANGETLLMLDLENTIVKNGEEILYENCKQKILD